MKKVNLGVLVAGTALCAILVCVTVQMTHQLVAFGEMSKNLMGRRYNTPDEY